MNTLAAKAASVWYLTLKRKLYLCFDLLLLTVTGYNFPDRIGYFSPYLPRTPDDGNIICILVSVGADVITPQRRFTRAPQGSPSLWEAVRKYHYSPMQSPRPEMPLSGFRLALIARNSPAYHFLGLFIFAARLIRSYMGYVPIMPSIRLSKNREEKLLLDNHDKNRGFVLSGNALF